MDYATRYHFLTVEVADSIALVTLNRPDAMNATNNAMHRELTEIWPDIDRDPEVRVAIVTGAGDVAFSAGGDIFDLEARAQLPAEGLSPVEKERVLREAQAMARIGSDPHLVSIFDIGEDGADIFTVQEFMSGGMSPRCWPSPPAPLL